MLTTMLTMVMLMSFPLADNQVDLGDRIPGGVYFTVTVRDLGKLPPDYLKTGIAVHLPERPNVGFRVLFRLVGVSPETWEADVTGFNLHHDFTQELLAPDTPNRGYALLWFLAVAEHYEMQIVEYGEDFPILDYDGRPKTWAEKAEKWIRRDGRPTVELTNEEILRLIDYEMSRARFKDP